MKISLAECLSQAKEAAPAKGAGRLSRALSHGSMSLAALLPGNEESERRNDQDTLYIVTAGSAVVLDDGESRTLSDGDALFVAAGQAHGFSQRSDDFAGWVVSWGPSGGEAEAIEPSVFAAIDA